jgi:UDP-N-acetylmuramate dehydrogenase
MYASKKEPLSSYTSFHIGGPAELFSPDTIEDFKTLLGLYPHAFILGGGTKLLFPDEGLAVPVILTTSLNRTDVQGQELRAETGARLAPYFDFMAGIAVTVGGALHNNFGAFGYETGAFVKKVRVMSATEDKWLDRKELLFDYRTSSIKEKKLIVAEAVFARTQTLYKDTYLRQRKETQPLQQGCAGSIFKNPPGKHAGQLIEACGLKGAKDGDAEIWQRHANFIVNNGSATCTNVKNLIQLMREEVRKKFNIELALELEIYG